MVVTVVEVESFHNDCIQVLIWKKYEKHDRHIKYNNSSAETNKYFLNQ